MAFDYQADLSRHFDYTFHVWHDNAMQGNKAPPNECLQGILGKDGTRDWDPRRWRGELLVHAYEGRMEDMRNRYSGARAGAVCRPVNVDTGSLGAVVK